MLQAALEHHQAGHLPQAEALYQQILQIEPHQTDALHFLGLVAIQTGRSELAIELISKALLFKPDYANAHSNLGFAFQTQGKFDAAIESYQKALTLDSNITAAHFNMGNVFQAQGKLEAAVESYRKALALNPNYVEAHYNLGLVLQAQGKLDAAVESYRMALSHNPNFADAHYNLALVFKAQGEIDAAVESYLNTLSVQPNHAGAHNNLGQVFQEQGKFDLAVEHYRHAILLQPDNANVHSNMGAALEKKNELDAAVESYRKALSLQPGYAEAHYNLGNVLRTQGKLDAAIESYRQALLLKSDCAEAHYNLANALQTQGYLDAAIESFHQALLLKPDYVDAYGNLGNALKDQGKLGEAIEQYRKALSINPESNVLYNLGNTLKDQGRLDEVIEHYQQARAIKPNIADIHSNLLFALNFAPDLSREEIYRAAQEYETLIGLPLRSTWRAHDNDKNPNRRLRIGYVSPDFRNHAVAYFAEPILSNHDKSQVEIYCYAEVMREDEITDRFRHYADHWHSTVGLSDEAVAQMIREHRIDILVDLAGHTAGHRLLTFARKPAPVQITYLGYPGTTGLSAMDYRITDHYADPDGIADAYYTEHLLRLPDSLCCYRPSADMPEVSPLPALTRGYLTFGSFNNFNKVDRPTLELWAELLRTIPAARLMMLTVPEGEARQRLVNLFAELGIEAQRLEFCGKLTPSEFHRKFLEVDITLDTVNVSGGTTTCESLWMGVPVIALAGERFITRVSYSFLNTAGLADFAATSPEDYIRVAAHLADNLSLLAEIRAGLRAHVVASPLIDEVGFTRNLEALYREVWGKWCDAI